MIATLSLTLLLAGAAPAPNPSAVVAAERSFSRMSEAEGIRPAFLAYLAEDAVIFRPGAVEGRKWYADRPASTALLTWEPAYAAISKAGDLGWTTGPWELRPARGDDSNVQHGHYATVWKKQADGSFKVVIDLGVSHAKPASREAGLEPSSKEGRSRAEAGAKFDLAAGREELLAADRGLSQASAASGAAPALAAAASDGIRVLRPGSTPSVGVESIAKALGEMKGILTWTPTKADVSLSGDLGFTYGTTELLPLPDAADHVQRGSYVRIWRREGEGAWKVALDIVIPLPETERPPAP
jgi:ketosteroid isomerase-like protein